jgi:hypothetical protein
MKRRIWSTARLAVAVAVAVAVVVFVGAKQLWRSCVVLLVPIKVGA